MGWRNHLPVHPAADLFPLMSESELRELGEDIKKRGLFSRIVLYDGKLLDGRNRLDAMELVGITLDFEGTDLITDDARQSIYELCVLDGRRDPYDFVVSANTRRRHLNVEDRQNILIQLIARHPERSNRQIAKTIGVDHKTVGAARAKGEELGSIPQLEKTTGADGKQRKSRKVLKAIVEGKAGDACLVAELESETQRATGSAEVSIEQRRAENARLDDDLPTEAEADESWQNDLYDQVCLLLERMADGTRQRFFAYLADADHIVERCLSLLMAMNKGQRAEFFAKYTELMAERALARP